jgi:N-acyl-D-amino-acid deacylase
VVVVFDVLIKNGYVVDGTGNPWYQGDVAIGGLQLVTVGGNIGGKAKTIIDGTGCVVSPGFVDVHTHSDLALRGGFHYYAKAYQGVTTELLGLDGLSYAPTSRANIAVWRDYLAPLNGKPDIAWDWQTVAEFLEGFRGRSPANIGYLVPHGALRMEVVGMGAREPTQRELSRMCELLDQGLEEGALGLSTALTYVPCLYATTSEMIALAKMVAKHAGFVAIHWRRRGGDHITPLEEVIEIGREAEVAVHVSHLQVSGEENVGLSVSLLRRIDEARDEGVDITFDSYPYTAGNSMLAACLPEWVWAEGPAGVMKQLADEQVRKEIAKHLRPFPARWDEIRLTSVPSAANRDLEGLSLEEAALRRQTRVPQLICDLLDQEQLAVTFMMRNGNEEDLRRILCHRAGMFASDGILVGGKPHPRAYGTFARILGHYSRDKGLLRIEEAVRRMTSFPANRLGLQDRGLLRPGLAADVVVFDPKRVLDRATFEDGRQPAEGVKHVLVNGQFVIRDGMPTGSAPGTIVHGQSSPGALGRGVEAKDG